MNTLFSDKRIFDQKSERYLVIDKAFIDSYVYLSPYVAIKKGDLLSPYKWIDYSEKEPEDCLIPLSEFNLDDYEYIFYLGVAGAREVRKFLGLSLLESKEQDYKSIFEIKLVQAHLESALRELIQTEDYITAERLEHFTTDAYRSGEDVIIMEYNLVHNIHGEVTAEFNEKEFLNSKNMIRDGKVFKLLQFVSEESYDDNQDWFIYCESEYKGVFELIPIYTIEDLLPYTDFK